MQCHVGILIRAKTHYVNPVSKPDIILIAGPTASGKSALALALAEKLGGAIINADSMQVYRDLRIITARPTPDEERRAPHRLYGHVDAAENYSVGPLVRRMPPRRSRRRSAGVARRRSSSAAPGFISTRSRAGSPRCRRSRQKSATRCARGLPATASPRCMPNSTARDPAAAARLMPGDRARVTRALEVVLATGRSMLDWHEEDNAGERSISPAPRKSF